MGKSDNTFLEVVKLLKSNHNLILTGAPGTGKTYLAKQIAAQMILDKKCDEEEEKDHFFKEHCGFVQFHPSYDYTDFVEGLRPKSDANGNIGFERKDGVFKAFCKKALKGNSSGIQSNVTNFCQAYINFILKVNTEITNNGQMKIPSKTNKDVIIVGLTKKWPKNKRRRV